MLTAKAVLVRLTHDFWVSLMLSKASEPLLLQPPARANGRLLQHRVKTGWGGL